ncbi:hypothetical protein [Pseudomonas alloputida]|uniref:hypothetical protein n=1 Tax=Pseudomonas alloputida TaxID=1940621 RepID=UPI00386D3AFD
MAAIVWLEIEGKLQTCSVDDPYAGFFQALNGIPQGASVEVVEHFRLERKRLAAEVVAKGAYRPHQKEQH